MSFESGYQPPEDLDSSFQENLARYIQKYDEELTIKYGEDNYRERLQETEAMLSGLPITHSTNIANIPSILQTGLIPYAERSGPSPEGCAILWPDQREGLTNYVFANIGYCPMYGCSPQSGLIEGIGRVTILIDDSVAEQPGSFFTFHDLAGVYFSANRRRFKRTGRSAREAYVRRITEQYPKEKLPLKDIYRILARTFLAAGYSLEQFLQQYGTLPPAYDPNFTSTNSGNPEIKINGIVSPDKFIGYVVQDEETRQALLAQGVEENKIIFSPDRDKKKI